MSTAAQPPSSSTSKSCCSLARLLLLVTLGAYLGLLVDIRVEHVDVVRRHWIPRIPLIYSGVMALLCLIVLILWNPMTRRIVFWCSLLAFIVGGLGFWKHNEGRMVSAVTDAVRAWYDPTLSHDGDMPPQLAPLAFAGVGLLGLLATAKRSQMPE